MLDLLLSLPHICIGQADVGFVEDGVPAGGLLLLVVVEGGECPLAQQEDDHDVDEGLDAHEDVGQVPRKRQSGLGAEEHDDGTHETEHRKSGLALGDELEVVAGLTQKWVDENARTAQDQDDFMTKYREYDARYQELQAKVDTLEAEKRNRQGRIKRFEVFIQALKKQQGELSDFDDDTWLAVIETVLVRPDGKLVFRFANGLEVEQ